MPVSYPLGTVKEVAAVRMASAYLTFPTWDKCASPARMRWRIVQSVTTNDAHNLDPDEAQYSLLLNDTGGIIDDIIVYCYRSMEPDAWNDYYRNEYLLVVNAGCKDKDWDWMNAHALGLPGVTLTDESDHWALLAVQGPGAVVLVERITQLPLRVTGLRFLLSACPIGQKTILAFTRAQGTRARMDLKSSAPERSPRPVGRISDCRGRACGLGARDVLRLEAAYPLYGHELDDTHTPAESGVGWAVKRRKGAFIGRDAICAARPPRGVWWACK